LTIPNQDKFPNKQDIPEQSIPSNKQDIPFFETCSLILPHASFPWIWYMFRQVSKGQISNLQAVATTEDIADLVSNDKFLHLVLLSTEYMITEFANISPNLAKGA